LKYIISIKAFHIYLEADLVRSVFKDESHAFVKYLEDQKQLLITPVSSKWFVKMYGPAQFLMKSRNLKGDKTLALHEIFIDNDLDGTERQLDFEYIERTKLIKIKLE